MTSDVERPVSRLIRLANDPEQAKALHEASRALDVCGPCGFVACLLWEAGWPAVQFRPVPRWFITGLRTMKWWDVEGAPQAGDVFYQIADDRLAAGSVGIVAKGSTDGTWFKALDVDRWAGTTYRADAAQYAYLRYG